MKKLLSFIIACSLISVNLQAQSKLTRKQKVAQRKERINQLIKQEEEGALIFNKQSIFGFKFNTDGFSFHYEKGKYKTIEKTNIWWLELGEKKDVKQIKEPPFTGGGGGGVIVVFGNEYAYGKQNNFYQLKLGFGKQRMIGGKGNRNGVAVSAVYGAGIVGGILKPYYLQTVNNNNQSEHIKYEGNETLFLDPSAIIGASGFTKGLALNELTVIPGGQLRGALRFDYGRYNEVISAIEVGLNLEYYSKKVPIMAIGKQRNLFFNAYINLLFGKRK
ncbi:MAG: hypothetical protein ACOVNY_00390 [Chitinophagaceae bacterium]